MYFPFKIRNHPFWSTQTSGMLSDHYDPRSKTLRLSPDVYQSNSLTAAGVAAHESGHAIQDKMGYLPLQLRSLMVPTIRIGGWLGPIIFMIGMFMSSIVGTNIAWIGIILFSSTTAFAFVTLPVEFNATKRAKAWLTPSGVITSNETEGINRVLDAAALTYFAAAIQALSTILYYIFLVTGRRRR